MGPVSLSSATSCGCGSSPVPSPSAVDSFSSRVPMTSLELWCEPLWCEQCHGYVHLCGGFFQFCALSVLLSFSTPCLKTRNIVRENPMWSRFLGCGVLPYRAVRVLLLCVAAVFYLLSWLISLGCCLAGLNWPAFAALAVFMPPRGRPVAGSVFGVRLHWQGRWPSWPVAALAGPAPGQAPRAPGAHSGRSSRSRRQGAGFRVGLCCRGFYWWPQPNNNRGLRG